MFQEGLARVGIVPSPFWLATLFLCGVIFVSMVSLRARTIGLLLSSVIVILPWLPIPVPLAFLMWTGPLRLWTWGAIATAILVPLVVRHVPAAVGGAVSDPRRAPLMAGAIAACAYLGAAWQVYPRLPVGDEPHYLIITQSLLADRDLRIENNHQRGDYHAYFAGELKPDYLARSKHGDIYSIHAPGLPAIVAPAFALFGYPGTLAFLALVSAAATGLAWLAVWRVTHDAAASWFAWAATAVSAPFLFQAFAVYPDALGGALVMAAVVMLVADKAPTGKWLFAIGTALALLPWLHTRFAMLAAVLGCVLIGRWALSPVRPRVAATLLAVPLLSATLWLAFFYAIYGTPNPTAPYGGYTQSELGNLAHGIPGLLFDQQFGLIPAAPVYLCALAGFIPLARRSPRLAAELLLIVVPYALTVAAYTMWWGGFSEPARFLVPIVLPLAIPIGELFTANRSRWVRTLNLAALTLTGVITLTMAGADRGIVLFNDRDGVSRLLRWLSPVVDLTTGFPSLFKTPPAGALTQSAIWLLAIGVTVVVVRLVARREAIASATAAVAGLVGAAMGMAALSAVWRINDARPATATTGTIALLHRLDPDVRQVAFRYAPLHRLAVADLAGALTVAQTSARTRAAGEPLLYVPQPVAATYEVDAWIAPGATARINVILDRQSGPLWSWDVKAVGGHWRQTFSLPTPASGMLVDTDANVRRGIDSISIRATRLLGNTERIDNREPQRAAHYGTAAVFFMAGQAWIERSGIWVAGGGEAELAIEPDAEGPIRLFIRSATNKNRIRLESGSWRQDLLLDADEARALDVPVETGRAGARVRVSASTGERASDIDPKSSDHRFLGVWVETQ